MNIYWGDIHNHCGISYGFGSLENALTAAQEQLDFCSVTGHAMWPDMLRNEKELEFVVKYHEEGFKKLAANWDNIRETIKNINNPGGFITFQGYEIHSSLYGDYHILSTDDTLPIVEAVSPVDLVEKLAPRPVIAIPHHVGYTPGYRGCRWEAFTSDISPVVEVYSKHGCGMSDTSVYPYLHTMGPRDSRTTVYTGLNKGYRFGFTASTDHHAGYPGSYGDGRMAVLAAEKTRQAIWDAILARHTYAVTGDKIECMFEINGKIMGSVIQDEGKREISLDVRACDRINKIVIYKNTKPWKIVNGELIKTKNHPRRYKIKVEMGWGKSNEGFLWHGTLSIKDGNIVSVEPCFRGRSILAPQPNMKENPDINKIDNTILDKSETNIRWKCTTFKNPTTLHSQTAALIFEIEGAAKTVLELNINGIGKKISIEELLKGSISIHVKPYNSEAIVIHGAVPETEYKYKAIWIDMEKKNRCDMYHVEIQQLNGQCAWISPIWIDCANSISRLPKTI